MGSEAYQVEDQLLEDCALYARDPWAWVLWAFPWGEGILTDKRPEQWQEDILKAIRDQLSTIPNNGEWSKIIREAVASGHGPGKSALIVWIVLWAMSTMSDTRGVVTANTEPQLRTKTLPELRKWHKLSMTGHWFTVTATAIFSINKSHERTWRIDFIPWSEHNPESFAGLHNEGKRVVVLFDEAAAIAKSIWDTTEGALTDMNTEIIFCVFGNPTRRDGQFAKLFTTLRHRWNTRHVDAREVRLTNKMILGQWVEDYGEDSNFVKVRVRGLFPDEDEDTLIPESWVERAFNLELELDEDGPVVLVCDVARFGPDGTVIGLRRDRVYTELEQFKGKNLMKTVGRLKHYWDTILDENGEQDVDYVVIDDTGLGGGVTDRLMEQDVDVRPFLGGSTAYEDTRFRNKRDEGWWSLREELRQGTIAFVDIEEKDAFIRELTMLNYDFASDGCVIIETKKQAKKRTKMHSPDRGDTAAMAFAPDPLILPL